MLYISVIIPTYNRVSTLEKCVLNLCNQTLPYKNYEIIIVDDCSADETPQFCQYCENTKSNIRYIRNEKNLGLASTRNVGIRHAKGELLVFLDNDLLAAGNYLEKLLAYHATYDDQMVAIMSNITYQPEVLKTTNFGSYIQSRAIGYRKRSDASHLNINDLPSNYFAGGGSSIKKKHTFDVGLFDENLKKYGSEDELFGYRFKKAGGKIVFCSDAKLIHYDQNIRPEYWRTKYIELGRYSLHTLAEVEPNLISGSVYKLLMPVTASDTLDIRIRKKLINFLSSSFFRVPLEKLIFCTDHLSFVKLPLIYRYLTMAWMKLGFSSTKPIEEVKY